MKTKTTTKQTIRTGFLTLASILALALAFSAGESTGWAQAVQPNCTLFFNFTATGQTTSTIANYGAGSPNATNLCDTWTLGYGNIGFGSVTLTVESAPAGATVSTPGTFVTYAGTVDSGVNPNTSTVGAQTKMHNGTVAIVWMRVKLTASTGSGNVFGVLQGWNSGSGGTAGGGGTSACPSPCPVEGVTANGSPFSAPPVVTGHWDGTNAITDFSCNNQATISISSATSGKIITGTSAKKTRVCHISLSLSTTANVTIQEGTGSVCGTSTASMTGAYQNVATMALDFTPWAALTTATAADDVCLSFSGSVTAGGVVIYATF